MHRNVCSVWCLTLTFSTPPSFPVQNCICLSLNLFLRKKLTVSQEPWLTYTCKWYTIRIQNVLYSFFYLYRNSLFEVCNIFWRCTLKWLEKKVAFAWIKFIRHHRMHAEDAHIEHWLGCQVPTNEWGFLKCKIIELNVPFFSVSYIRCT